MKFYNDEIQSIFNELNTTEAGLNSIEVEKRQKEYGINKLKEGKKVSLIKRFLEQLADPMIIILIAAAGISFALAIINNDSFADVIIIAVVVLVNAILGVYQEAKAEAAIDALKDMTKAESRVKRNGAIIVVKSEELTVGDIVLLEAGDSVPADGRIIKEASLSVEEAALTGESVPVNKTASVINDENGKDIPLGDRRNMVYMGSTVVYGHCEIVVTGIGMNTEMGKIADALTKAQDEETPLQIKLKQLSKILTIIVIVVCLIVFAVGMITAKERNIKVILDTFMIAVSLAVAAIPEGLAAVVTVVLSMGVTKMSERNAIIRKLTAVETLGCAEIICTDKTGTLTQNKMTVVKTFGAEDNEIGRAMALCCDAEIGDDKTVVGEPTEAALVTFGDKQGENKNELMKKWSRIGEAPFDSMRKMMSVVLKGENKIIQYTKGAPDVILKNCKYYKNEDEVLELTDTVRKDIEAANKVMADEALRVLACAEKVYDSEPSDFSPENLEKDLCFLGLTGMIDPVREEVKPAMMKCKSAGITPIMITGDHKDTAVAIAKELRIFTEGKKAITGAELDEISEEDFEKEIENIAVYSRVQPEHKTRIVNMWKKKHHVTAMTGDGVNDAPSIKSADIGVGMGITGTDVTKNVADMVLADDNFATIIGAVEEGRRIYDNIRKSIQYLLASNMAEVLSVFFASMMGFVILKPVHLLWINLVTDTFPALALGMEEAEPDIMIRKPRKTSDGIFAEGVGVDILYQGIITTILIFISYFIGTYLENGKFYLMNSRHGTTMAFLTMSMAEVFHSFNLRSRDKSILQIRTNNNFLLISAMLSLLATTAVCEVPFLANLFNLTEVGFNEYAIAAILGLSIIPIVEAVKLFRRIKHPI